MVGAGSWVCRGVHGVGVPLDVVRCSLVLGAAQLMFGRRGTSKELRSIHASHVGHASQWSGKVDGKDS